MQNDKEIILIVKLKKSLLFSIYKSLFLLLPNVFVCLYIIIIFACILYFNDGYLLALLLTFLIFPHHFRFMLFPLMIRKIICYDEYFEIIRLFSKTRIYYDNLKEYYFEYLNIRFSSHKILHLSYKNKFLSSIINTELLNPEDLEKFIELLNAKGINKQVSIIDDKIFYNVFSIVDKIFKI